MKWNGFVDLKFVSLSISGEVLLDKISDVRTVVNKTNIIDNTYRNFSMEILAGEENMITTAKENGFLFEMDFSKVFWNSRLGMCIIFSCNCELSVICL